MSLVVITRLVPLVLPTIVDAMRWRLYILEGRRPEMVRVSTEVFTTIPGEKVGNALLSFQTGKVQKPEGGQQNNNDGRHRSILQTPPKGFSLSAWGDQVWHELWAAKSWQGQRNLLKSTPIIFVHCQCHTGEYILTHLEDTIRSLLILISQAAKILRSTWLSIYLIYIVSISLSRDIQYRFLLSNLLLSKRVHLVSFSPCAPGMPNAQDKGRVGCLVWSLGTPGSSAFPVPLPANLV